MNARASSAAKSKTWGRVLTPCYITGKATVLGTLIRSWMIEYWYIGIRKIIPRASASRKVIHLAAVKSVEGFWLEVV